ncbi:MAG TPA: hypothetical protein VLI90_20195 [Tepidisphaeraceae bacterium]|nr:hypothetical protein [Tepidisphaeraceae bacterium]
MKSGRWSILARGVGLAMLILSGVDCQADRGVPSPPAAAPTTAPSSAPTAKDVQTFEDRRAGVRFNYPSGWAPEKAATAVFDVAAPASATKGYASISLDVPSVPPHFPGMITPKIICDHYVKDLRENQIHDAKVEEAVDIKAAGAPARRVKCSGHEKGKVMIEVAVVIVHSERIYIFSCDADPEGYAAARAALDQAVATLEWIK